MNKIAGYTKEAIGFDTPFLPLPKKESKFLFTNSRDERLLG